MKEKDNFVQTDGKMRNTPIRRLKKQDNMAWELPGFGKK